MLWASPPRPPDTPRWATPSSVCRTDQTTQTAAVHKRAGTRRWSQICGHSCPPTVRAPPGRKSMSSPPAWPAPSMGSLSSATNWWIPQIRKPAVQTVSQMDRLRHDKGQKWPRPNCLRCPTQCRWSRCARARLASPCPASTGIGALLWYSNGWIWKEADVSRCFQLLTCYASHFVNPQLLDFIIAWKEELISEV